MTTSQRKDTNTSNDNAPVTDVAVDSPDVQAAAAAGISEGEVKALRDDAGVNFSAGHQANIQTWEASEQGQEFLKAQKERNKEAEEGVKKAHADLDKEGLSEADKKFAETVAGKQKKS